MVILNRFCEKKTKPHHCPERDLTKLYFDRLLSIQCSQNIKYYCNYSSNLVWQKKKSEFLI
jgi:hypothetical protein